MEAHVLSETELTAINDACAEVQRLHDEIFSNMQVAALLSNRGVKALGCALGNLRYLRKSVGLRSGQ